MPRILDAAQYLDTVSLLLAQGREEVPVPVTGTSMTPFLHPGDQVFVSPVPDPVRPGMIFLYRRASGQYVLHRLIRIEPRKGFWMAGDAQTVPELIARQEQLVGVVTHALHNGRRISPGDLYWRFYAGPWRLARPLRPFFLAVRNLFPAKKNR